jgi:hypothetical protein
MPPPPGLSSASGKPVAVKFDSGVLALREIERRPRVADRLAACRVDPRAPDQIAHSWTDIVRFRLLMIGAGYKDGANELKHPQAETRLHVVGIRGDALGQIGDTGDQRSRVEMPARRYRGCLVGLRACRPEHEKGEGSRAT